MKKPRSFDRNVIVIGAGSAGLVSAYIAAAVKAKVTLIEKHKMGGDCLNTGCVPSKALLRSARVLAQQSKASDYGFKHIHIEYDFAEVMERVQRVIKSIEPHDSIERYTDLGVECIEGEANITSPWSIEVNGKTLTTRSIIIATGARPFVPPIPGLDQIEFYTSDTIWSLRTLPKRLVVLGGGPVGSELAQAFSRLGSDVTQTQRRPGLLIREDPEVSALLADKFSQEGIRVLLEHEVVSIESRHGKKIIHCDHKGTDVEIECDSLLIAIGRKANTEGLGLEHMGIDVNANGTVASNHYLQTHYPNIFCCGDVAGPYQFTHTAAHQAWYASVNALFGRFKKFKVDYSVIPWATFTEPEIARVGLNETDALAKNIPYEVTRYGLDDLDRAIADETAQGFVKVLTAPGKDRVLGATIVGEHAGDLITEYITAMKHGLGMNRILQTIHIYPTLSEANKFAAGNWKKTHTPQSLLTLLGKYHQWQRR